MDFEKYRKYISADVAVLLLVAVSAIFYFFIALTSPIVFGDENNYAVNGKWIAQNLMIPEYSPLFQTAVMHNLFAPKPLFYMFVAFSRIAGEFGNKMLIPIFSILTSLMIYVFLKKNGLPKAGMVAAFAFLMLPGLVTYGALNYVETSLVLFFAAAAIFGFYAFENRSVKNAVLAGIFSGFALLTDTTGFFIIPLFIMYFILLNIGKSVKYRKIDRNAVLGSAKALLIILAVAVVILSPWLARNLALYNGFCYTFLPGDCSPKYDVNLEPYTGEGGNLGASAQSGTGAAVVKMGFPAYFNFAFGWAAAILLFFGLAALAARKDKMSLFVGVWFFIFLVVLLQQSFFGGRAEDTPRYTLFGFASLAILVGIFASEGFDFLKKTHAKYGAIIGIVFIMLMLSSLWVYGADKLNTMKSVKTFSAGFFDACGWVDRNTPKDSYIFSTYAQHVAYHCNRNSTVNLPDQGFIQLANNDSAYEHLKLHGFDYVFVPRFTISIEPYGESISLKMLGYMESSDKFQKVYDNSDRYEDYVLVYKALPESHYELV
ncbi:MAG: glycosyltransferase family 39 protein [Nanoarchaeota archaeon]|nr:glycosyltransferase family 39 protein [Nanoarchaeota archaeon]